MTRDELVDLLEVERYQPLPPAPGFVDTPALQAQRRSVLGPEPVELDAVALRLTDADCDVRWVRRGLILVARDGVAS